MKSQLTAMIKARAVAKSSLDEIICEAADFVVASGVLPVVTTTGPRGGLSLGASSLATII